MNVALITIFAAAAVAWANGANDVSKSVATLIGSRLATYRRGLSWGTLWTIGGAAAAWPLTSTLLGTFSTALVGGGIADSSQFPLSVAFGAFVWIAIASRTGLPVSTTHSLAGAIAGTAIAAGGVEAVNWTLVLWSVAAPLLVSPFLAAGLSYLVHATASRRLASAARLCVCGIERPVSTSFQFVVDECATSERSRSALTTVRAIRVPLIIVDTEQACAEEERASGLRLTDAAHWMASAALSFARGLNDTPKIVALGAFAAASAGINGAWLFGGCAVAMGAGSLLAGRKVTRTLAERVTAIDPLEGLSASGVAATLVLLASVFALPVSTTHVASGAIVGVGLGAGAVRWTTVSSIAAAWLITMPVSALISAAAWRIAGY
jgi:PiT family inorganic phosphate transporter